MQNGNANRDTRQANQQQPGDTASFNNRDAQRSAETEDATAGKDVDESYMDYNGNSEQNAPVGTEEGE